MECEREIGRGKAPEDRTKNWNEFRASLSEEEQRRQGTRYMNCGVPFCQSDMMIGRMVSGCPLHDLVPEWNNLVHTDNQKQAYNRLRKTNSFPELAPRVRPAPCEAACACSLYGDAVATKESGRAITEKAYGSGYILPNPPSIRTGKKVAAIGSDPAGLAAADWLNERRHSVTVFERNDRVGGLLMCGIPNTKLKKQVIEHKVDMMRKEGITSMTEADAGGNYRVGKIGKGLDRIILACGASNPRDIGVPGRGSAGIYFVVDFLKATTESLLDSGLEDGSFISVKNKCVLVIGSGDTGNDCADTSIRYGCVSITQLEMIPKPPAERTEDNAWPEWLRILKAGYGQEEAMSIFGSDPRQYQATVKEFIKDGGSKVCKAIVTNSAPKKDKEAGRTIMAAVEGSEREIPANLVFIATDFTGAQVYVIDAFGIDLDTRTNAATEPDTYRTSAGQIFAAGDMRGGQPLIVQAVQEGHEATKAVDRGMIGYTSPIQLQAVRIETRKAGRASSLTLPASRVSMRMASAAHLEGAQRAQDDSAANSRNRREPPRAARSHQS